MDAGLTSVYLRNYRDGSVGLTVPCLLAITTENILLSLHCTAPDKAGWEEAVSLGFVLRIAEDNLSISPTPYKFRKEKRSLFLIFILLSPR